MKKNLTCADCYDNNTSWASVNLGVFLCTRCAQIHRGIGTHITKIKGCGGTYLWYPDEIEMMQNVGNNISNKYYLNNYDENYPNKDTSENDMKQFIINKYDKKFWI